MTIEPIAFSGHGLDRADQLRVNAEALEELRKSDKARVLSMDGLAPRLDHADRLAWSGLDMLAEGTEVIFLGLRLGVPLFVPVPEAGDIRPSFEQRQSWLAMSRLSPEELAIYGGARSLADWHARHRFCANCGKPTGIAKGGWQRSCSDPACNAQHFPRVDPVAIMLVEHDGDMLLGRGLHYPERLYSALAGFVEPGESIEEAVAREVFEEAGVALRDVTYVASQPWPFPSQLMIGCHAFAESRTLEIDTTELADARWFTRAEIAEALELGDKATSFRPPLGRAIASHLLRWWLERPA